jgi:hypothetical protein
MAWSHGATKVEVLFHTLVANLFPLIMLIKERMRLVLIDFRRLAHIRQRLFNVVIVFRTWGHALRAHPSEVKLGSITNTFLIDLILESRLVGQILYGQLSL